MKASVLEKLINVEPEAEIWWDSSPVVLANWRKEMIAQAEDGELMTAWLDRLFSESNKPCDNLFRGVTTNPPLSYNAIKDNPEYWKGWISGRLLDKGPGQVEDMFWETYLEIVRRGAGAYLPMFEQSQGRYGYISGQTDPRSKNDVEAMVRQGLEIAAVSPNVMVKVPGTAEGYETIRILTAKGISTNNTLSMIVPQFIACMEAVAAGLREAHANRVDLSRYRSVITSMSSRFGGLGDLQQEAAERSIELSDTDIRWAEIAIFKKACRLVRQHPEYNGKMLLCSMRLNGKEDGSIGSMHIEEAAGENVVYTCPPSYIGDLLLKAPDLRFTDTTAEEVPTEVMDRLMQLPYFRKGYAEDGYRAEEFSDHPAVAETARQFSAVTEEMVAFVAKSMADCRGLKAA